MPTEASPPDELDSEQERKARPRSANRDALSGTTRRVYRYIYRRGPVRLHDIQRDLRLSSSSLADYHVQKLLTMKLIREEKAQDAVAVGFVAEEAVFEAMVRVRRTVIPLRATLSAFFAVALVLLVTILRPAHISSTYVFSLVVTLVALSTSVYETIKGFSSEAI
jgi:hypothetical protein